MTICAGTTLFFSGCCRDDLCSFVHVYLAILANKVSLCCAQTGDHNACFNEINTWNNEVFNKLSDAYQKCITHQDQQFDDLLKQLYQLIPKNKVMASATGAVINSVPILFNADHVCLDVTATPCGTPTKITTVIVGGTSYLPAAAGNAAVLAVQSGGGSGGQATSQIVLASDAAAPSSNSYCLPEGATLALSLGHTTYNYAISGTFSLSDLKPDGNGGLSGFPTGLEFTLSDGTSKISLSLDATVPYNAAQIDASGHGYLRVAVTTAASTAGWHFPDMYKSC